MHKREIKLELKGSKTEKNLMAAFAGESQARNKYDYFASKAKKDGYEQIAANIEKGEVWVKVGKNKCQCRNCGAIVEGEKAPTVCPVCDHPQAYFQLEQNNF